jgi:amino-acid N-acetyltransferase
MGQFETIPARQPHRAQIISLLEKENLPKDDLPAALENFFIAKDDDKIVGAIGLERYGNCGLLRSMVVDQQYRNRHIATELVQVLEAHATTLGVDEIFLLTETAASYFSKKGYQQISREEVPLEVQSSSEFSLVCPVSATVMRKSI